MFQFTQKLKSGKIKTESENCSVNNNYPISLVLSHQSAAIIWVNWIWWAALSHLDSDWTVHPLWTAGCFCEGDRPARTGALWAAGWGACIDILYRHPAEKRIQEKVTSDSHISQNTATLQNRPFHKYNLS